MDDTATANLSTNDMVIQKLSQVLAYLRADNRKKKGKDAAPAAPAAAPAKPEAAQRSLLLILRLL